MIEFLGYLGGFLMAGCGAPLAYSAYKKKSCDIDWSFLYMWLFGELSLIAYVLLKYIDIPLLLNYTVNVIFVLVLIKYNKKEVKVIDKDNEELEVFYEGNYCYVDREKAIKKALNNINKMIKPK